MKKSGRVALGGMMASLSLVVMLAAYFPYVTYALPALAGCFLVIISIEINKKWAFVVYAAVGALSFLVCEKEAAVLYIFFFGYYPILKAVFEQFHNRVLEWICKYLVFNVALIAAYLVIIFVLLIDVDMMGDFGKYAVWFLLALGNVVFFIYDIALTRAITFYLQSFHPKIRKIFG